MAEILRGCQGIYCEFKTEFLYSKEVWKTFVQPPLGVSLFLFYNIFAFAPTTKLLGPYLFFPRLFIKHCQNQVHRSIRSIAMAGQRSMIRGGCQFFANNMKQKSFFAYCLHTIWQFLQLSANLFVSCYSRKTKNHPLSIPFDCHGDQPN